METIFLSGDKFGPYDDVLVRNAICIKEIDRGATGNVLLVSPVVVAFCIDSKQMRASGGSSSFLAIFHISILCR